MSETEDEMIARGVREGWIRRATAKDRTPPPRIPVCTFDDLMRDIDSDRHDRDGFPSVKMDAATARIATLHALRPKRIKYGGLMPGGQPMPRFDNGLFFRWFGVRRP